MVSREYNANSIGSIKPFFVMNNKITCFIPVPPEATWGVLRISTDDKEKTGRFLVHTMQLLPKRSCRCHETQKMINVNAEAPTVLPFQLVVS